MPKKRRKIVVIGKLREFDDEGWKRLLMAYAYYLHEQSTATTIPAVDESAEPEEIGGTS